MWRNLAARLGQGIEGFSDEAMELLLRHDWPGNIRELINLIERIFIDPPQEKIVRCRSTQVHALSIACAPRNRADRTRDFTLHLVSD